MDASSKKCVESYLARCTEAKSYSHNASSNAASDETSKNDKSENGDNHNGWLPIRTSCGTGPSTSMRDTADHEDQAAPSSKEGFVLSDRAPSGTLRVKLLPLLANYYTYSRI